MAGQARLSASPFEGADRSMREATPRRCRKPGQGEATWRPCSLDSGRRGRVVSSGKSRSRTVRDKLSFRSSARGAVRRTGGSVLGHEDRGPIARHCRSSFHYQPDNSRAAGPRWSISRAQGQPLVERGPTVCGTGAQSPKGLALADARVRIRSDEPATRGAPRTRRPERGRDCDALLSAGRGGTAQEALDSRPRIRASPQVDRRESNSGSAASGSRRLDGHRRI